MMYGIHLMIIRLHLYCPLLLQLYDVVAVCCLCTLPRVSFVSLLVLAKLSPSPRRSLCHGERIQTRLLRDLPRGVQRAISTYTIQDPGAV